MDNTLRCNRAGPFLEHHREAVRAQGRWRPWAVGALADLADTRKLARVALAAHRGNAAGMQGYATR